MRRATGRPLGRFTSAIEDLRGRHDRRSLLAATGLHDLPLDPAISPLETFAQRPAGGPADQLADHRVVGSAPANALGPRDVPDAEILPRDLDEQARQLIDGHHLLGADVHRPRGLGEDQTPDSLHALVDVEERACLLAVPPDLDLAAVRRLRDLPRERGRRLLLAPAPRPFL